MTNLTFINHSSVLIRYQEHFLLTDPWFEKPAFGSWLPTFPMVVHPAYLAALKDKLSLLISHGHDDHCDDDLLRLFDKDTAIISSDYASPSVSNRVKRIGLTNYFVADETGVTIGPFTIKSFRNDAVSLDDATYSVRTPDALIIHCNDNWNALTPHIKAALQAEVDVHGPKRAVYMSQTNSASGFPLNYRNFDTAEKKALLLSKVRGMIREGTKNAAELGIPNFITYAGFASVFVKGKPEYLADSIFPTPALLTRDFGHDIPESVKVLDIYPGDTFDFEGVRQSFLGRAYDDEAIKSASTRFYELYGKIDACDTYRASNRIRPGISEAVDDFLTKFDTFVRSKVDRSKFAPTILGKTLSIVLDDTDRHTVKFGTGLVSPQQSNKEVYVSSELMTAVLNGESLFENLYTGYNAEFKRNPPDQYNRDIMSYLVMYSYVHLASVRAAAAKAASAT
ncbi:MBL fold metallo-hydrolase [Bradyrhizobium tropiciagri]|uniref:MBL fold metallo-hydrolase n=1 Tax=Bradyrhizobium tropiciagri TaxID=312253 RepID=UPI001BAB7262|nr:MBL fold metallo-hydrolase [Bradyrhizobium tropiciagri]MBR0875137.1 MBL fold metallo-hydrolase [Bradyrhizobium tropiciagri]